VPRRVRLPDADDLFRPTGHDDQSDRDGSASARRVRAVQPVPERSPEASERGQKNEPRTRRPSGRVRHDEKMTVYVTADELVDLEHARLALRRDHGLAVDRGRMIREAIAVVLADLEEHGHDSMLVQRLTDE
jgi:hypothetical protein